MCIRDRLLLLLLSLHCRGCSPPHADALAAVAAVASAAAAAAAAGAAAATLPWLLPAPRRRTCCCGC
eukprot:14548193-Alexandrium_andersonii.AAC.1